MDPIVFMEEILYTVIELGIILLEAIGAVIILWTAIKCVLHMIKHQENVRLDLAQGIALALEFKLGGEVLRTVIVREWKELLILGAVVVIRAALTILIHWEIKNEEEHMNKEISH